MLKLLLIFVILISTTYSFTQCNRVLVSGRVIDSLRPQTFYNLMVINKTVGRGVFGEPNGSFSVYVMPNDLIALSIKEYPIYEFFAIPDENCQCKVNAYIEQLPQEIEEVIVRPLKTLSQIKDERQALSMRETRLVTGINMLESPITALYQAFSKKEQNKLWIQEQKYKDDQRRIVKELLRLYVAFDIINMTEEDFDSFIQFLNIDDDFLKTASEMELILFIKDKFDHYNYLKK